MVLRLILSAYPCTGKFSIHSGGIYSTQFAKPGRGEKIQPRKKQGQKSAFERVGSRKKGEKKGKKGQIFLFLQDSCALPTRSQKYPESSKSRLVSPRTKLKPTKKNSL